MPADILGSQDRLFDAMQYTDDPVFTIVGVQRTILAITVWHQIIAGSGLMPAKFSKWQIGAGVHWLGGCCYPSLGVMWVPRDKAMRTRARIQTVLDGVCTPTTYRELVGFLEHVTDIGQFPRELMQHLHHPMRAGGECELDPHGKLQPDGRRDGYLRKWRSILLNTPGSSILSAVQHMPLDPTAHAVWRLRSDAMLEPYGSAMGGCLYGTWWRFPLIRPELTIPVLELLAACVNFLIFADQLSHARQVVMEIDALASPIALTKDKARSPGLRAVLAEFRRLPALQPFVNDGRLFCAHCWGEGNPLGDAASRGKLEVISAIGSALGMHMQQVAMGSEAIAFINRVLARLQSQPLTTAEIEFDSTLGYPGEGPPDEMPSRSSPPPSCRTPAPAQASPTLLAFLTESEQRADTFHPSASSPLSRPFFPAAPPSPPVTAADGSPLSTFASPPPVHPASHHPSPPSPSPVETAFAAADAWCPSLLPAPAEMQSAEEHHRAFAAAQCAHVAAETSAPSLLLQLAEARINTRPHPPPPAALAVSSAASWTGNAAANTMSIAATARAQALTAALASSAANGGIRLDEGEADELACRLVTLLESAAATNTLKGERSNWKHWLAFCTHRNIAPMRPDVKGMTHGEYDSEVVYLALGLLFVHGRMGCRRGRSKPPRPSSALAVLRGIRRAHARLGIQMADLSLATRLADALNKEYIAAHGWEALNVNRVAPLTNAIIQGMIAAPCISDSSLQSFSTRAMWATLAQTGFRKAEVATDSAAGLRQRQPHPPQPAMAHQRHRDRRPHRRAAQRHARRRPRDPHPAQEQVRSVRTGVGSSADLPALPRQQRHLRRTSSARSRTAPSAPRPHAAGNHSPLRPRQRASPLHRQRRQALQRVPSRFRHPTLSAGNLLSSQLPTLPRLRAQSTRRIGLHHPGAAQMENGRVAQALRHPERRELRRPRRQRRLGGRIVGAHQRAATSRASRRR